MISAVIQEDGYEVSLRINFISASPEASRVWNTFTFVLSYVLYLWSHLYAIFVSSRLPLDSRVDPWRLRIRISVLWQRELQPAQVHIYTTNVFGRLPIAIFFYQPMCIFHVYSEQQFIRSQEKEAEKDLELRRYRKAAGMTRACAHWHVYKKNVCMIITDIVFLRSLRTICCLKSWGRRGGAKSLWCSSCWMRWGMRITIKSIIKQTVLHFNV